LVYEKEQGINRDLLWYLQNIAHLCEASDPRDLVYAFFGLSDHHFGLQPDYSKDYRLEHILTDLARELASSDGGLSTISSILEANFDWDRFKNHGLASWIPDWHLDRHFSLARTNESSRRNILEVRGIFHGILSSSSSDETSGAFAFHSVEDHKETLICRRARGGDEVWMLHGANNLFVLRRDGSFHMFLSEALDENFERPKQCDALIKELTALIETNSPLVQTIRIC
jgi:hypothetical protein